MNLPISRNQNGGLVPIRPSVEFTPKDENKTSPDIDWRAMRNAGLASLTASLPLGTAAWSVRADTETFDERKGDFWLGFDADGNPVGSRDDRHILVVGGNRSGKGISALVTNLLLWRGSMVVIDPKGENAMVTLSRRGRGSKYAQGLYQPTYLLDPYGEVRYGDNDFSEYRASFNPLDTLDPNGRETVSDAPKIREYKYELYLPRPNGQPVAVSYVGAMKLEISRRGTNAWNSETIDVGLSAPSSGHQVVAVERHLGYNAQADQPRISEVLAGMTGKLGNDYASGGGRSTRHVQFRFDDGQRVRISDPYPWQCMPVGAHANIAERDVPGINRDGHCDVVFDIQFNYGISDDHAEVIWFKLGDNERARQDFTADYQFFRDYVKKLQSSAGGAAPKL